MKRIRTLSGKRMGGLLATFVLALSGAFAGTALANHNASDVNTGTFFHDEIGWLLEQSIANGFNDGTFKPEDPIKRQQLALWLSNYNNGFELVSVGESPGPVSVLGVQADCPAGKRALAGGGRYQTGNTLHMTDSGPQGDGSWIVRWEADGPAIDPAAVTVWALCAPDSL